MQEVIKKPLTVALAAVLLFSVCVPVPTNNDFLDRVRYEQAHANPGVAVIAGTLLLASGVMVAGGTMAAYETNLGNVSNEFVNWCAENLYHDDIDAAIAGIQSCVNAAGNIDLGAAAELGIMGEVSDFSSYLLQQGIAVEGDVSTASDYVYTNVGNFTWNYCVSEPPDAFSQCQTLTNWSEIAAYTVYRYTNGKISYGFIQVTGVPNITSVDANSITLASHRQEYFNVNANGSVSGQGVTTRSSFRYYQSQNETSYTGKTYINTSYVWNQGDTNIGVTQNVESGNSAIIDTAIVNAANDFAGLVVQPFNPTAEQLQAGYDYTAITEAINGQTGVISADLSGIAAGISGLSALLSPLAGIAANVQNIRDWWSSFATSTTTPLPWLDSLVSPIANGVSAIQTWLGDTPFGDVMGDLLDGVLGIPDAVVQGAQDVCGVLDGVLDATLGLAGDIADALGLDAVADALLGPIEGILEAVQGMNASPSYATGTGIALSNQVKAQFDATVRNKAPFCYVLRAQDVGESIASNIDGTGSFYLDFPFPYMNESLHVDATPFFSQTWGGLSVAQYIRILVSGTISAGLIALAVRVAMRTVGAGSGD